MYLINNVFHIEEKSVILMGETTTKIKLQMAVDFSTINVICKYKH